MKLKLTNFRCHESATFDFGDKGVTLISGQSGCGKSTIFSAIYFALYGSGTKLVTYGKTSCCVELEFEDMKIMRSRRPNRLLLNDIYEDDAAQELINERFGRSFDVSGYIPQNSHNSFVLMSPTDKLSFLERFAFANIDLAEIKAKCKNNIVKCNESLLSTTSKLQMAKEMLRGLPEPEFSDFPVKCKTSQREKVIRNHEIKLKNNKILQNRIKIKLSALRNELTDAASYISMRDTHNKYINSLERELNESKEELSKIREVDIDHLKRNLSFLVDRKELTQAELRLEEDKIKLNEMIENEISTLNSEIENLESQLWQKDTRNNSENELLSCEKFILDAKHISQLKNDIQKLNEKLCQKETSSELNRKIDENITQINSLKSKMRDAQNILLCPSCNTKLKLEGDTLVLNKTGITEIEGISTLIQNLTDETTKLKSQLREVDSLLLRLNDKQVKLNILNAEYNDFDISIEQYITTKNELKKYIDENITREKELKNKKHLLSTRSFSASCFTFEQSVNNLSRKVSKLRERIKNIDDFGDMKEEVLREELEIAVIHKEQSDKLKSDIRDKSEKLSKYKTELEKVTETHKKRHGVLREICVIQREIKTSKSELTKLEASKGDLEAISLSIEKWSLYKNANELRTKWKTTVEDLKREEEIKKLEYAGAECLREAIRESESIALLDVINSINSHAQIYLDVFFPEEPISIKLTPFKQTKKINKPQITMEINYKGMECELGMLSGGEVSRVTLAYTLALSEMFNTPLLLLDECTASLDQEMTAAVFAGIREHFNGKLTLIIAHQTVSGLFDSVVEL